MANRIADENDFKSFIAFLKINECYEEFCEFIVRQRNYSLEQAMVCSINNFHKIIDQSLTWSDTRSGQRYWSDLNTLWKYNYINSINLTNGCRSIW